MPPRCVDRLRTMRALDGDWTADVAAHDTVHRQILAMADMLCAGIIG